MSAERLVGALEAGSAEALQQVDGHEGSEAAELRRPEEEDEEREGDEGEQAGEHEGHPAHARAQQLGGDLEHACGEGHTRAGVRRHVVGRYPRHDSAHPTTAWYSVRVRVRG